MYAPYCCTIAVAIAGWGLFADQFIAPKPHQLVARPRRPAQPDPRRKHDTGLTKREYAGTPIYQIADLKLDPTSDGKILVVTAYATRAGAANAEFEAVETAPAGELHFVLNAEVDVRLPVGSPTNRQLTAGKFLSTGTLDGIRKIVIIGETNSLSIRP